MQIKDILKLKNVKLIKGDENAQLSNFSKDTRTIMPGDTYIGIKGEVYDGSTFYEEAILKGAKTCILGPISLDMEFINNHDCNIIVTDDPTNLLMEMAKLKRSNLNIPIIAVTGSVGKTSTKNIISDVLKTKYNVLKTPGNLNTCIGLSLTILSITNEDMVVLEMGMNNFGEISKLTNIAKPTVAVITNIGTAHIGNLGSRENILKAKLEILEGLNGPIFINNDNDLLNSWAKTADIKMPIVTYGIDNESDYQAKNLKYTSNGSTFNINDLDITINVLGKHFIYNATVAYAIGKYFDIPDNLIDRALKNIPLEPNRMEIIKGKYTIINDTYNSSYDSVYYSLEILGGFPNRKIAVLGDILELGDFAEDIHLKIGDLIVKNKIDILVTIGSNAAYINDEALKNDFNKDNSYHFNTNNEAINLLNNIKKEGDTILVKASNGMHFKEIVDGIK